MAYEPVNWKNKGEDGAKPINKDNLGHMDEGIEALDLNKIEISKLVAATDTAPTEFNNGDKYYNTTDKCIYTADDTNWGTTGEDPATNKLYVDLSESKLYYYDGIDFKAYGGGSGGGETLPVGTILPYTGGTLPSGYMVCDGSAINRTTYATLFGIVGTNYGAGDGTTTFNLPNLKGRVPVGQDDTDTDFDTLGKTGGEKEHTLTPSEIPNHTHVIYSAGNTNYGTGCVTSMGNRSGSNPSTNTIAESNCKDQPHNNLQPYQVVRYIIKVSQTTPIQSQVVGGYSTSTEDSYSCNYVNNAIKEVYSAEEVKTNKVWVDENGNKKPVYRKEFDLGAFSFINGEKDIPIPNTPVDILVDGKYRFKNNNSWYFQFASVHTLQWKNATSLFYRGTENFTCQQMYVTLEYTKATN